jgi:hypothetical protein
VRVDPFLANLGHRALLYIKVSRYQGLSKALSTLTGSHRLAMATVCSISPRCHEQSVEVLSNLNHADRRVTVDTTDTDFQAGVVDIHLNQTISISCSNYALILDSRLGSFSILTQEKPIFVLAVAGLVTGPSTKQWTLIDFEHGRSVTSNDVSSPLKDWDHGTCHDGVYTTAPEMYQLGGTSLRD